MATRKRLCLRNLPDDKAARLRAARDSGDAIGLTVPGHAETHYVVVDVACDDGGAWRATCHAVTVLGGGGPHVPAGKYRWFAGSSSAPEIAVQVAGTGTVAVYAREAAGTYKFVREVPLDDLDIPCEETSA